jgi:hypothetical protein
MAAFIDRISSGGGIALWLDYTAYAGRLLAGGTVPWLDVSACAAWQRKAQGLLHSDVVSLPVAEVCSAWLESQPSLRSAMGARSRAVFPLKTLLADEALRTHLVDLSRALRGTVTGPVFALACPSPRHWVGEAYGQALGTAVDVGDDEADSAALYLADFLRAFGDSGVDTLLLVESPASEPGGAAGVACYQSALNVAAHYRWDIGLEVPGGRYEGGDAGLDFVIAPHSLPGALTGLVVPETFWNDDSAPEPVNGGFRFAAIPPLATPERVLERLALLR